MTTATQSPYTEAQTTAWLRGLLAIAWADGDFDAEEQKIIVALTQDGENARGTLEALQPISPDELAAVLGNDAAIAQNFLRTAVMVALADGVYSTDEDDALQAFCAALNQQVEALDALRHTLEDIAAANTATAATSSVAIAPPIPGQKDALTPVREWLDRLEMQDPKVAHFLCKMIPSQCPFERDIVLFGRKIVHIPPMCKLNPLYEQLVGLRFRALSYLADDCGEDVTPYF
jgi:tellurite resistance protein